MTGGTFYRGTAFPAAYQGSYFFSDFCQRWIKRLTPEHAVVEFSHQPDTDLHIVNLRVGPEGCLYYLSHSENWHRYTMRPTGVVRKICFVGIGNRHPQAVVSVDPDTGHAPLEVWFNAEGSQDPDGEALAYRWEFGDGSPIAEDSQVRHTYGATGFYTARLTVVDPHGETDTAAVSLGVGNPPVGRITVPVDGTTFQAGTTMVFEGTGTDREDGELPASAFRWEVALHHHPAADPNAHTHPFLPATHGVKGGSFSLSQEVHDQEIWFRLHLVVTDSDGLPHESTRDLHPRDSFLRFETVPPGLPVALDGQSKMTPVAVRSMTGSMRTITAPLTSRLANMRYRFESWSDGGAATHDIETPRNETSYTARYVVDPEFDPTLAGHWSFDERPGSNARVFGSSENEISGVLAGDSVWTTGRFGGGLRFDGVDDFVRMFYEEGMPRDYEERMPRDWTISCWVRSPAEPSGAGASGPIQRGTSGINWNHPDPAFRGAATVRVGGVWYAASYGRLRAATWYHMAATYDGKRLLAYKNGALVTTNANPTGPPDRNTEGLKLGAHAVLRTYFEGAIDEVRLYTRALSAEEILTLAQEGLATSGKGDHVSDAVSRTRSH